MMTATAAAIPSLEPAPPQRPCDVSPKASTLRMRHLRERQKAGLVRVKFDLTPDGIELLTETGWLASAERNNTAAVERAFGAFVNRAAAIGVHPEEPTPAAQSQPSRPVPHHAPGTNAVARPHG